MMRFFSLDSMEEVVVGDPGTHRPACEGLIARRSFYMNWMHTMWLFVNICGMCSSASHIVNPSYSSTLLKSRKLKEICLKSAGYIRGRSPRTMHNLLNGDGLIDVVFIVRLGSYNSNGYLQFGLKRLRICWGVAGRWKSSTMICLGRSRARVLWYSSNTICVFRKRSCNTSLNLLNNEGLMVAVSTIWLGISNSNGYLQFGMQRLRICWGVAVRWKLSTVICLGRVWALMLWYFSNTICVYRGSEIHGRLLVLRASGGTFTMGVVPSLTFGVISRKSFFQFETLDLDGLPNVKVIGTYMYVLVWIGLTKLWSTSAYYGGLSLQGTRL